MSQRIEILAPGGDINAIKSAILAGADAIYCGLNKFNARNRAANISFEDLQGILRIAHQHHCEVFLTLNIIILDSEVPALIKLLNRLVNTSIDGVIVQDFGLFYLINTYFPSLKIHASTQLTTHNSGQIKFLKKLNAERVNLSRELNISEIKHLTKVAHTQEMKTEVFVHGSCCISFSGLCYMSSLHGGNSGNRGQCSQPCRERYLKTPTGNEFPLNLKDNSAYLDLKELYKAGVDSIKIEGRIKDSEYVYTTVNAWRKQVDKYTTEGILFTDNSALYKVFNRDFSNGFLTNNISKNMFIDNPMNHSITYLKQQNANNTELEREEKEQLLLDEKRDLRTYISKKVASYDISKQALQVHISGKCGSPLSIYITTPQEQFEVRSTLPLSNSGKEILSESILLKRLKAINDTEFYIQELKVDLKGVVYIPFKELTTLKKQILKILNGGREFIAPITLPKTKKHKLTAKIPHLSILISSNEDVKLVNTYEGNVFYQLTNSFKDNIDHYYSLFKANKTLIPWFPSILIGEDFSAAIALLNNLQSKRIVTNNTGIAIEAAKRNIHWIAGPQLNITNSYSLLNLKETFKCSGAFLSNEISKQQMLGITPPDDFELYYTIFQPITLMTSRQCFFQQVSGCSKHSIDNSCISQCAKTDHIINLKGQDFIIEKSKGNYHRIFNETHLLNTDIAADLGSRFDSFTIDLSQLENQTKVNANQQEIIQLFKQHISGDNDATKHLHNTIFPTTNSQYINGI